MTNSGVRNGGIAPQVAAPTEDTAASASKGVAVTFTSALGLLQRLRDTRDAELRQQLEALALGHVAAKRETALPVLLPVLKEWLRAPRNTGAEGLFLTVLSGLQRERPADWEPALAFLGSMSWAADGGSGLQLFLDLSVPGKAIASYYATRRLPAIVDGILAAGVTADVGQIVRGLQDDENAGRIEERWMSYATCDALMIAGGWTVGGLAGMALGSSMGPVGTIAGAVAGGLSGAADGAQLSDRFCAGLEAFELPGSTGPFNPDPPGGLGMIKLPRGLGDWCWTFDPRSPFTPPFVPRPLPRPFPPPYDPRVSYPSAHLEAAELPDDALRAALVQRLPSVVTLERLGPNALMMHNLPIATPRGSP